MGQRLEFIDIAKGIGIILVVIGHSIGWLVPYHWIYSFHMPFFFFISGFLFTIQGKNFLTFTKKRIRSLLLPAMFFTILLYSIDYCYPILDNSEKKLEIAFCPMVFTCSFYDRDVWFCVCKKYREVKTYQECSVFPINFISNTRLCFLSQMQV